MDALVLAGRVSAPVTFARSEPVIVVSREAAGTVQSLLDLPRAERIVLGGPEVPIGRYAARLLDRADARLGDDFRARVEAQVVSREPNVRQVLTKVRLGEADAAIVYRTDALTAPDVVVVPVPPDLTVTAEYPVAVVVGAESPRLARAWIALLRSDAGRAALSRAGFLPPDAGP